MAESGLRHMLGKHAGVKSPVGSNPSPSANFMCEHCNDDNRDNECKNGLCPECCGLLCHHDDEVKPKHKKKKKKN